jgi:hypothetical protein
MTAESDVQWIANMKTPDSGYTLISDGPSVRMEFTKALSFAAIAFFLCIIGSQRSSADQSENEAEIAAIEDLAFPSSAYWPYSVLVKWPGIVHFGIVAQREEDATIATAAIGAVISDLPPDLRDKVQIDSEIDLESPASFQGKAIIYIGATPYDDLDGSLKPLFVMLSNGNTNNDALIGRLKAADQPDHIKFSARYSGEMNGFLLLVKSSLESDIKQWSIGVTVLSALSPSVSVPGINTGLFEDGPGAVVFTKLGHDFLRIMLSDEVKSGMSRKEFDKIVRRIL